MEIIGIMLLIAGVGFGVAYIFDPSTPSAKGSKSKPIAIAITLVLFLLLFRSCAGFLDGSGSSSSSSNKYPTTAEEAASQYYYDKDGHIRMKG